MADKDVQAGESGARVSRRKLLLVALPVVLLLLAGAFFFLRPPSEEEKLAKARPKEGEVVKLEPVNINLADGHFLKLGLALQATDKVEEAPNGAKALDLAIALFSGQEMAELKSGKNREEAKKHLAKEVGEAYHGEVMEIYFTEFVMQ